MQPFRPLSLVMLVALCTASALAFASPSGVVISGFQTRGSAGGNDEYVEIRNTTTANVDISGWRLQGCAAGTPGNASNRATVGANIVLTPGQHYLFTNSASAGYSGSVPGDATYATGFTDFATSNFAGIQILDAANVRQDGVGSNQSPCREGTGFNTPTANGPNDAFARTQDTDNNLADFVGPQATNPHNSGGIIVVPPTCTHDGVRIFAIQGRGHVSPMNTQTVCNVPGIVTQLAGNGFYMQDGDGDGDTATSDGIFVFTSSAPSVLVGQQVKVLGTVSEFRAGSSFGATNCPASSNACGLTITEITAPTATPASGLFTNTVIVPVVLGSGGRIPPNAFIDNDTTGSVEVGAQTTYDPAQDGIDFYETVEGMQVQVNDARATAPGNSFGEIWLVGDNGANASGANARGGLTLIDNGSSIDFNPERILIDVGDLTATPPMVNVGDTTPVVAGAMTYGFGNFRIMPATLPVFSSGGLQRTASTVASGPDRLRIASYNVENLDANDGDMCDGRPDRDVADGRFTLEAQQIVGALGSPEILGIEELQDNSGCTNDGTVDSTLTLTTLIQAIVAAGGPTYSYTLVNPVDNADGGAPGANIRQAVLYNAARVTFVPGTAGAGDATTATALSLDGSGKVQLSHSPGRIDPNHAAWANSRKPLAATFDFNGHRLLVIVNHFNSKIGDGPQFGRIQPPVLDTEAKRLQQAQVEHDFIRQALTLNASARIVTLGDFNDFDFSAPMRVLTGANTGTPILTDLATLLPPQERYSYVFEGNSQELDHIYATGSLLSGAQFQVVHINAEFADQVSDHDPMVASLVFPLPDTTPPVLTVPAAFAVDATSPTGATVTFVVTATDNSGAMPTVTCTPASGSILAIGNTTVTCTAADGAGNSATSSFVVTVRGVAEQTARLVADVLALKDIDVNAASATALANALQAVLNNAPNQTAFCTLLTVFAREVDRLSPRVIPAVQAAQLVASANRIKAVQGCR
jgi:predicted extracellular nuclease